MKAKKMIQKISVVGMLTALLVGGSGNLYAQNDASTQKLQKLDSMVADLSLSQTQQDKYSQFKSSLEEAGTEKDMEFVNKLINVMSF